MPSLTYVTGNPAKLRQAQAVCEPLGIALQPHKLQLVEIQAETGEPIARDKAQQAFAQLATPLVVSDDSWYIPGLNGFPGPYMKSMNDWFSIDDWLRLTRDLTDRRIVLRQIVVYQDEHQQQLFAVEIEGMLLTEARGVSPYPHTAITSFDGGKHTNAEFHEAAQSSTQHLPNVWHQFTEWYTKH